MPWGVQPHLPLACSVAAALSHCHGTRSRLTGKYVPLRWEPFKDGRGPVLSLSETARRGLAQPVEKPFTILEVISWVFPYIAW
jgi:hypothetical protein